MRKRCRTKTANGYKNYGGRGITICDRWKDFAAFLQDMGEAPPGLSIDRINNDGNYEPSNCRWATPEQQRTNKRNPQRLSISDVAHIKATRNTHKASDIAARYGVSVGHIHNIRCGLSRKASAQEST
jgi:hypothetical protein